MILKKNHSLTPGQKKREALSACFFSHTSQLAGAERSLLELVTELIKDHGVVCTVVLPNVGPLKEKLEEVGASTLIAEYSWWCEPLLPPDKEIVLRQNNSFKNVIEQMLQELQKINPDVVFTNTMSIPWGAIAASFLGKPHVWSICEFGKSDHGLQFYFPFEKIPRFIRDSSNIILTNSKAVKKALFGDTAESNILTIYRYIDIAPNALRKDRDYFTKSDSTKLIIAGTICEMKGQKDAILAVKELVRRGRNVELIIAGCGVARYLKELKDLVKHESLEGCIKFIDFQENVHPIIDQADIVLVCSKKEAFGRVTLEGMLLKKPVIGTNSGGTPELIKEGFNGLLYDPGNHVQLADKIESLLTNKGKMKKLGETGYKFAKMKFTREAYGGKVYKLLKGLKNMPKPLSSDYSQYLLKNLLSLININKAAIGDKDIHIATLDGTVKDKVVHISTLESAIKHKDAHILNLENAIRDKDTHIAILDGNIKDKDAHISDLETAIRDKDIHIATLDGTVKDKDVQISTFESAIKHKDAHISNLETAVRDKDTRNATLNGIIQDKSAQISTIGNTLREIESSLSYKVGNAITMPLSAMQEYLDRVLIIIKDSFLFNKNRISEFPKEFNFHGYLDSPDDDGVKHAKCFGWFVSKKPLKRVELFIGDKKVVELERSIVRKDVDRAVPDYASINRKGFEFFFPGSLLSELKNKRRTLFIRFYIDGEHYIDKFHTKVGGEKRVRKNGHLPDALGVKTKPDEIKFHSSASILFIGHDAAMAGGQVVLLSLIKWFSEHTGITIKVILLRKGTLLDKYKKIAPVLIWEDLIRNFPDKETRRARLREFIGKVDLIYGNTIEVPIIYDELGTFMAPFITHVHELEKSIQMYIQKPTIEKMRSFTNGFIAGSKPVGLNLIRNHGIDGKNIATINDFIEKRELDFAVSKKDLRKKMGLIEDGLIIFGCGTMYWRKGVDLFIETALKLKQKGCSDFHFYWIGENIWDSDQASHKICSWKELEHRIHNSVLKDHITFLGAKENFFDYFLAGDIFYLPSREDPFPLVCLEAAQCSIPIICFEDAGGIPDFVENDAGFVVPYEDVNEAAEKIIFLDSNRNILKALGETARKKILLRHCLDIAAPEILNFCRKIGNFPPAVSIIIPNYNSEKYLEKRLNSILNQTFKDFEMIICDDASTDKSLEIIKKYLHLPFIRLYKSRTNSGNPFVQWRKGFSYAKGELVWVAEADDYCKDNFLFYLLKNFNDENVGLSYCQSIITDENDENKGDYLFHTNNISEEKWKSDYVRNGVDEIEDTLFIRNTIPNASAVVFRRKYLQGLENVIDEYRMAGDWFAYVFVLHNSKIAFCHLPLNFHRRHSMSNFGQANSNLEKAIRIAEEIMSVQKFIIQHFYVTKTIYDKGIVRGFDDFKYLTNRSADTIPSLVEKRKEIEAYKSKKVLPDINKNIMIVVSDTEYGGGQLIAIRLANFLAKNNNVYLYTIRPTLSEAGVEKEISSRVVFLRNKNEDVHFQAITDTAAEINEYIKRFNINYISSHDWLSDKTVFYAISDTKVAWILTMHGYYEDLIERPAEIDIDFNAIARSVLQRPDKIIYTANKNLKVFEELEVDVDKRLIKILNGYVPQRPYPIKRAVLSIPEEAFIFSLVGRGIPEKGWSQAIQAVVKARSINQRDIHLLLIGDSDYINELKNESSHLQFIHFLGFKSNLADWIATSDAALFPSYFVSESQPLTLIEFMAQGKPIIATDIGEIGNMIIENGKEAGILLHLKNGTVDVDEITNAIIKLVSSDNSYKMMSQNATELFSKYSMNVCAGNYLKVMNDL